MLQHQLRLVDLVRPCPIMRDKGGTTPCHGKNNQMMVLVVTIGILIISYCHNQSCYLYTKTGVLPLEDRGLEILEKKGLLGGGFALSLSLSLFRVPRSPT